MNEILLGCFLKIGFDTNSSPQDFEDLAKAFSPYIWGEKGISTTLKKLKNKDYGRDLALILFEFYVKPSTDEIQMLKDIGSYRKKELSIGIPIIVNDANFFSKLEEERYDFLKQSILTKLELLSGVVKKKKLDTNMELLKSDLQEIFSSYP